MVGLSSDDALRIAIRQAQERMDYFDEHPNEPSDVPPERRADQRRAALVGDLITILDVAAVSPFMKERADG